MVSKLWCASELPREFTKIRLLGVTYRISDSVTPRQRLQIEHLATSQVILVLLVWELFLWGCPESTPVSPSSALIGGVNGGMVRVIYLNKLIFVKAL